MEDYRLQWFKEIIYRTLSIDTHDNAFLELLEKNKFASEYLTKLISFSNDNKASVFFYCTVEEEEVEVEDSSVPAEESEKVDESELSESEKLESENVSIDGGSGIDNDDDESVLKADSPEEIVSKVEVSHKKRLSRRSTTSLLQIIKKNVLHFCLNLTDYIPSQRYVYFLQCNLDPIPVVASLEEAFKIMPNFFELGSINQHPLISMNKMISRIYLPILKDKKWLPLIPSTECKLDEKEFTLVLNDFYQDIEEFLAFTEETILQIEKPFMFNTPNIASDCVPEELAQERSFVAEAEELVNEWTDIISDLLAETTKKHPPKDNLLGEIKFWQRQKLMLSTCYDHLNKSSVQQTVEILTIADSDISDFLKNMEEVKKHLKTATDNFNYLSLLQPAVKDLLPEKPFENSQKAIEDIFMLLKMIWLQSNYYTDIPNMCRLIKGISILLKEKVKQNANVEFLFRKKLEKIHKIVTDSSELLKFWKDLYFKECENVKKYGGSYWWGFEITAFFTETDHMIDVCSDLRKVTMILEELYNIFNTNLKFFVQDVKGLHVLEVRVFGITSRIQYANFDVFNPEHKSEWETVMKTFHRDVKNFEEEIKLYIGKMFRSTLSWESAYILTKSFNTISVSPSVRGFINKCHDDMLKQFIREINEKENEFLSFKDDPPCFPGIPYSLSSIIWVQDLIQKLFRPVSQICDHSDLTKKETEVMERYKKTELLLREYKHTKYEAWKVTAIGMLNKFLQGKVLKTINQASNVESKNFYQKVTMYQVNFPVYLEEVSTEAKLLEFYGYDIPTFIKNAVLQEKMHCEHRHEIRMILESVKKCISTLNNDEISILEIPIENLCSVLNIGLNIIQWESVEVSDFVKRVKRASAIFKTLVSQVQNVFLEIDRRINSLSDCGLFQFNLCDPGKTPACEEYFGDAELEMEIRVQKIVDIYSSLPLLLKNLEIITCKTSTGEAIQMKQYYRRCEEEILKSLLKMTLLNLEYFKDEVLKSYIYPYLEVSAQSEDEFVFSSLTRAELIFITFVKNVVESSRKIKRWQHGTCIPTATFCLPDTKEQLEFSYYLDICLHSKVKDLVLTVLDNFFNFMKKLKET